MGWNPRWSSLWMAFPSVSAPLLVPVFPLDRSNFGLKFLRWVGGPISQLGAMPNLWIWSLQVLSPLYWVFQLMSSLLGPGSLLLSWHLGLLGGYPQFPILATHFCSISWPLYISLISSHNWSCYPYFPSPPKSLLPSASHDYCVPPSKKDKSIHTLVFLLLELHMVCEVYCGYSKLFFLNIHLLWATMWLLGLKHEDL